MSPEITVDPFWRVSANCVCCSVSAAPHRYFFLCLCTLWFERNSVSDNVCVIYLAVNRTASLPVFIQNILNCVLKTNEALMGLERHGGRWLMTTLNFVVEWPFNMKYIIFKHDKSVIYLTLSSFQSRITFLHGTENCLAESSGCSFPYQFCDQGLTSSENVFLLFLKHHTSSHYDICISESIQYLGGQD